MAVSTQRIIFIVLVLNILVGIAYNIYENPTVVDTSYIDNDINQNDALGEQIKDETYWNQGQQGNLYEPTIGSPIKWGNVILDIFTKGMHPFTFKAEDFTTQLEQMIAKVLTVFRGLLHILLILEIYLVIKNRKAS